MEGIKGDGEQTVKAKKGGREDGSAIWNNTYNPLQVLVTCLPKLEDRSGINATKIRKEGRGRKEERGKEAKNTRQPTFSAQRSMSNVKPRPSLHKGFKRNSPL